MPGKSRLRFDGADGWKGEGEHIFGTQYYYVVLLCVMIYTLAVAAFLIQNQRRKILAHNWCQTCNKGHKQHQRPEYPTVTPT